MKEDKPKSATEQKLKRTQAEGSDEEAGEGLEPKLEQPNPTSMQPNTRPVKAGTAE